MWHPPALVWQTILSFNATPFKMLFQNSRASFILTTSALSQDQLATINYVCPHVFDYARRMAHLSQIREAAGVVPAVRRPPMKTIRIKAPVIMDPVLQMYVYNLVVFESQLDLADIAIVLANMPRVLACHKHMAVMRELWSDSISAARSYLYL